MKQIKSPLSIRFYRLQSGRYQPLICLFHLRQLGPCKALDGLVPLLVAQACLFCLSIYFASSHLNIETTADTMTKPVSNQILPEGLILSKIYVIRGLNVMIDRDLAALYEVDTSQLKRQVRRNSLRFPTDFMFELTDDEFKDWRCQSGISNEDKMGLRYKPFAFTEEGVAQLSTVLNSERAIKVNIQIIRMFTKMRSLTLSHKDIVKKLEEIERQYLDHDQKLLAVFNYLDKLKTADQRKVDFDNRKRIGYKP